MADDDTITNIDLTKDKDDPDRVTEVPVEEAKSGDSDGGSDTSTDSSGDGDTSDGSGDGTTDLGSIKVEGIRDGEVVEEKTATAEEPRTRQGQDTDSDSGGGGGGSGGFSVPASTPSGEGKGGTGNVTQSDLGTRQGQTRAIRQKVDEQGRRQGTPEVVETGTDEVIGPAQDVINRNTESDFTQRDLDAALQGRPNTVYVPPGERPGLTTIQADAAPEVQRRQREAQVLQQRLLDVQETPGKQDYLNRYDQEIQRVENASDEAVYTVNGEDFTKEEYLNRLQSEKEELEEQEGVFRDPETGQTVAKDDVIDSLSDALEQKQQQVTEEIVEGSTLDQPESEREARIELLQQAEQQTREDFRDMLRGEVTESDQDFGTSTDLEAFDRRRNIEASNLSPGEVNILETAGGQAGIEQEFRRIGERFLSDEQAETLGQFAEETGESFQEAGQAPRTPGQFAPGNQTGTRVIEPDIPEELRESEEDQADEFRQEGRELAGSAAVGTSSIVTDPLLVTEQVGAIGQTLVDQPRETTTLPGRTAEGAGIIASQARRQPVRFALEEAGPELVTGGVGGTGITTGTTTETVTPEVNVDVGQMDTSRVTTEDVVVEGQGGEPAFEPRQYEPVDTFGESYTLISEDTAYTETVQPGLRAEVTGEDLDTTRTFVGNVEARAQTQDQSTEGTARADLVETTEERRPVRVQTVDTRAGIGLGEQTLEVIEPRNEPSTQFVDFEAESTTVRDDPGFEVTDEQTGEQQFSQRNVEFVEGRVGENPFFGTQEVRRMQSSQGFGATRTVAETQTPEGDTAVTGGRGVQIREEALNRDELIQTIVDLGDESPRDLSDLTTDQLRERLRQLRETGEDVFGQRLFPEDELTRGLDEASNFYDQMDQTVENRLQDFDQGQTGEAEATTVDQTMEQRPGVGTDQAPAQEVFREAVRREVESELSTTESVTTPQADAGAAVAGTTGITLDQEPELANPLSEDVAEQPVQDQFPAQQPTQTQFEDTATDQANRQRQIEEPVLDPVQVEPPITDTVTRTTTRRPDFDFDQGPDEQQTSEEEETLPTGDVERRYTPSLFAGLYNVEATEEEIQEGDFSGLEVRPLVVDTEEGSVEGQDPLAEDQL